MNQIAMCFILEEIESDPELFFDEFGDLVPLPEWTPHTLQAVWDRAIESFPYELEPTSIEQGTLPEDCEADTLGNLQDELEYSVEYTFDAGSLGNSDLIAGGWVEMRFDPSYDTLPAVYAWFGVCLDWDWEDSRVLGEFDALQAGYDVNSNSWDDLSIESM